MFEKEIKFIVDYNLNKIKSLGSYISFEKIAGSGVHPAIVQYISAELDYLIAEDRKKLLQQSLFDYTGTEIAKHFNLISQEIKKNKKIAYEDLKKLVIQAVSFNINFLVRPRWSLSKLVFNETGNKSTNEIKLTLNYVFYYDYLKNIFLSYLMKRSLDALSLTEFELILNKIDNEIMSDGRQKMVDYSLYEMAEFFNPESRQSESGGKGKSLLPLSGVEMFLKEKNLMEFLFRLKKAFPDTSKLKSEVEDIRKAIYADIPVDIQPVQNEDEAEVREANSETKVDTGKEQKPTEQKLNLEEAAEKGKSIRSEKHPDIQLDETKVEVKPTKAIDSKTGEEEFNFDVSLDEELLSLYNEESDTAEEKDAQTGNELDKVKPGLTKENELDSLYNFEEETNQLLKDFDEAAHDDILGKESEKDEPTELDEETDVHEDRTLLVDDFMKKDENAEETIEEDEQIHNEENQEEILYEEKSPEKYLFDFISDKDIRKIISAVFNNDRDDFLSTVDKIGECKNYEEATEILKGVFLTYRINPYSKEAVALTNSVANFFNQV